MTTERLAEDDLHRERERTAVLMADWAKSATGNAIAEGDWVVIRVGPGAWAQFARLVTQFDEADDAVREFHA